MIIIAFSKASDGDLRRAITFLQSIANLKVENSPTIDDIYDVTGVYKLNNFDTEILFQSSFKFF